MLHTILKYAWISWVLGSMSLAYGYNLDQLNIDSLKREIAVQIEQNQLSALLKSYETLGRFYYQHQNYEDAISCYSEGIRLANRLGDTKRQFFFSHYLGAMYFYPKDDYQQSLDFLLRAQEIAARYPQADFTAHEIIRNKIKLAEVYNTVGDLEAAFAYQIDAIDMAETEGDTVNLALGYRILGVIHGHQDQDKLALKYFQKSFALHSYLQQTTSLEDEVARENEYNYFTTIASIGATYLKMDSLRAALPYIEKASVLADSINHAYGQAYSEALKGILFFKEKSYDEALVHLNRCVDMFKELGLRQECAIFSLEISYLYLEQDEPWAALKALDRAEADVASLSVPRLMRDIYQQRSEASEKLGRIEDAYLYYKKYVAYRDSLVDEDRLSALTATNVEQKQAVREQQQQIETLQEASDSNRRLAVWIGLTLTVVFLAAILMIARMRNRELRAINLILNQKNEEIRQQNERLASSNEDLRQFAHVTSHDLREPLRSIGSFATLLRRRYEGQLDEEADEFISFIEKGVRRMDKLLGDLLAYSMAGIFQHKLESVEIKDVISLIINRLHKDRAIHGVRITLRDLPVIYANRSQIVQLFSQLIDNAIKFRSDEKPQLLIRSERKGNMFLFMVQDNGIGMEEAYQEKIFGLFLRLHTRKSQYQGTGVGLSICKKIVEQHQGKIWIESQLGVGTTVYFTLPEDPTQHKQATQNMAPSEADLPKGSDNINGKTLKSPDLV